MTLVSAKPLLSFLHDMQPIRVNACDWMGCDSKSFSAWAGALACWNHPFEVARIEAQARGDQGQKDMNMVQIFKMIVKEQACALGSL